MTSGLSLQAGRYEIDLVLTPAESPTVVCRARDLVLDRAVVVSIEPADVGLGGQRLLTRARLVARVGAHPHLVSIFDVGSDDGRAFIVEEFMPGGTVAALLEASPSGLALDRALEIAIELCLGIEALHDAGLAHRAIRPSSVFLDQDGGVRLGDFEAVAPFEEDPRPSSGHAAYLSPEQARGVASGIASDLYSLGVLLFELVSGRTPFEGPDLPMLIAAHLSTPAPLLRTRERSASAGLEALVAQLLAKQPDERPGSALTVRSELERLRYEPPEQITEVEAIEPAIIGRAGPLDRLGLMLTEAAATGPQFVVISGEAGIGKSRLLREFEATARASGAVVHAGGCTADELTGAFEPWQEILAPFVTQTEPAELLAVLGDDAPALSVVFPEIQDRLPGLGLPSDEQPEVQRQRLIEGFAALVSATTAEQEIAVVAIEDLHAADALSVALLRHLANELHDRHVLFVATLRAEADSTGDDRWLKPLLREPFRTIELTPLDEAETFQLLRSLGGDYSISNEVAARVHTLAGGNPMYISAIADELRLHRGGDIELEAGASTTLARIIESRLVRLSPEAVELLEIAAVIGDPFDLALLGSLARELSSTHQDLLGEAERQRLIERDDGTTNFRFRHAVVREVLLARSGDRRNEIHARVAHSIEIRHRLELSLHVDALAYHFGEAGDAGDPSRALDYARRAAVDAISRFDYLRASEHFDRALAALDRRGDVDARERCELMIGCADARWRAGRADRFEMAYQAADIAETLGDGVLLIRAVLTLGGGIHPGAAGNDAGVEERSLRVAVELLEADQTAEPAWSARANSRLALMMAARGAPADERTAVGARAVSLAADDSTLRAFALNAYLWALYGTPKLDEQRAVAEEFARVAARAEDPVLESNAHAWRMQHALERADLLDAEDASRQLIRVGGLVREPLYRWRAAIAARTLAIIGGDAGRIAEASAGADAMATALNSTYSVGVVEFGRQRLRSGLRALVDNFEKFHRIAPHYSQMSAMLAYAYARSGRREEAAALFDQTVAEMKENPPVAESVFVTNGLLARCAAALQDGGRAGLIWDALEPHRGRMIVAGMVPPMDLLGAVDFHLALIEQQQGSDGAGASFKRALELHERLGAAPALAEVRLAFASFLAERGSEEDRARATELLESALAVAEAGQFTALIADVMAVRLQLRGAEPSAHLRSIELLSDDVLQQRPNLTASTAPDGRVAILFTDIESSTALSSKLGDDGWIEILVEHNRIVRETVAQHSGHEVKSLGDGFMLAFASPAAALHCASAIREGIRSWAATASQPIRVRMGIHAGTPQLIGQDYFGYAVNLAARISSVATADQILLSSAVVAELGLPADQLERYSGLVLKGIPEPQDVFAYQESKR